MLFRYVPNISIYLWALLEFSFDHFLCFEAVATSPHAKSSPPVAFVQFAFGILSLACAAPQAQAVCAYTLLNMTWALMNGYFFPVTRQKLHVMREQCLK